jgi:hypothetical protein
VGEVIPTRSTEFRSPLRSIGLIRSSLKVTSTSGGVRAATVARERLGIGAFSSTAGEMSSNRIRVVIFFPLINLLLHRIRDDRKKRVKKYTVYSFIERIAPLSL